MPVYSAFIGLKSDCKSLSFFTQCRVHRNAILVPLASCGTACAPTPDGISDSGDLNRSAQHIAFETKGVCDGTTTEAVFLCGRGERRDLQPMAQGRIWSEATPSGRQPLAATQWTFADVGHPSEANKTRPERGKRRRFGNFLELLNPAVKDVLRHQVRFKGWRAGREGRQSTVKSRRAEWQIPCLRDQSMESLGSVPVSSGSEPSYPPPMHGCTTGGVTLGAD